MPLARIILLLIWPLSLSWPGEHLVVEDPLEPADSVLPLAGDPVRLGAAARLFGEGFVDRVLVTRLPLPSHEARDHHVETAKRLLVEAGVAEAAIDEVPGSARSTWQEALNVRAHMMDAKLDSLIVVTNPWHTRRARMLFRQAFSDSGIAIRVRAVDDGYDPRSWWRTSSGRRHTIMEYMKFVAHAIGLD